MNQEKLIKKLQKFTELFNNNVNSELLKFIKKSSIQELQYYLLKCKDQSSVGDTIKSPERVIQFLSSEINRRFQIRLLWIPVTISIISVIISIILHFFNC